LPNNVPLNPAELTGVSNQVIVAFVLPERSRPAPHCVGAMPGKPFEWAEPPAVGDAGRDQQMDVIGDDDKSVELVAMEARLAVESCLFDEARNRGCRKSIGPPKTLRFPRMT